MTAAATAAAANDRVVVVVDGVVVVGRPGDESGFESGLTAAAAAAAEGQGRRPAEGPRGFPVRRCGARASPCHLPVHHLE